MAMAGGDRQKVVIVGAGPVGALAALYAARRGDDVEIYELRGGMWDIYCILCRLLLCCFLCFYTVFGGGKMSMMGGA
jgi:hypothetical protein